YFGTSGASRRVSTLQTRVSAPRVSLLDAAEALEYRRLSHYRTAGRSRLPYRCRGCPELVLKGDDADVIAANPLDSSGYLQLQRGSAVQQDRPRDREFDLLAWSELIPGVKADSAARQVQRPAVTNREYLLAADQSPAHVQLDLVA